MTLNRVKQLHFKTVILTLLAILHLLFLPKPLSEDEVEAAIAKAIGDTGAATIKDMGKVMGALKAAYAGRMDFGAVGSRVRAALG